MQIDIVTLEIRIFILHGMVNSVYCVVERKDYKVVLFRDYVSEQKKTLFKDMPRYRVLEVHYMA